MINNTQKIAVIGKENVVSAFKFVGFETHFSNSSKQCENIIDELYKNINNYAIIFITENFYEAIKDQINKINQKTNTSAVLIPDNTGSKNIAQNILSQATEQAVGSDILSK